MSNQIVVDRMLFECWAYKNGKPWRKTEVIAANPEEAEEMAWKSFRNIRILPAEVVVKDNVLQMQ